MDYTYETLAVTRPSEWVLHVQMNRPKQLNTLTPLFFSDLLALFSKVSLDPLVRCVLYSARIDSKIFTAGLDLKSVDSFPQPGADAARQGLKFIQRVQMYQDAISSIEKCNKPVIVAIHGACIGGGLDLITACDIRYASKDAVFSIKEVDVGLCADLGTLQRLPSICSNGSWVREMALTAKSFSAKNALDHGLVSRLFDTKEELFGM